MLPKRIQPAEHATLIYCNMHVHWSSNGKNVPLLIREYMHRWEFCGPVQSPEFSDVRYSGNDIQPYVPGGPTGQVLGVDLAISTASVPHK